MSKLKLVTLFKFPSLFLFSCHSGKTVAIGYGWRPLASTKQDTALWRNYIGRRTVYSGPTNTAGSVWSVLRWSPGRFITQPECPALPGPWTGNVSYRSRSFETWSGDWERCGDGNMHSSTRYNVKWTSVGNGAEAAWRQILARTLTSSVKKPYSWREVFLMDRSTDWDVD